MARTVSLCLEEGQPVWFQSGVGYMPSEVVIVTSVGRLWAVLDNGLRCNRYTGEVDGGKYSSPGTIYCTEEDYRREVSFYETWSRFQKDVAARKPLFEDLTRRQIMKARRILKLDD